MKKIICTTVLLTLCLVSTGRSADQVSFTGTWVIDIRSKSEPNAECGHAYFTLLQNGNRICGDHVFYTPGCGRLNEGNPGSVQGTIVGSTAILVVTSGRNGGIVMGKATRKANTIHWVTLEEIKSGEPEGDSPLILGEGTLKLDESLKISQDLVNVCKNR